MSLFTRPTIHLIGRTSRIGLGLQAIGLEADIEVVGRETYSKWIGDDGELAFESYMAGMPDASHHVFVLLAAITNPKQIGSLYDLNVELPLSIARVINSKNASIITLGTALERFNSLSNPYVESKRLLAAAALDPAFSSWTHIRLHTVFGGGIPSPHMFTGQILSAIQSGQKFKMSDGHQLREYQNYLTIAKWIHKIWQSGETGLHEICFGAPVSLGSLAEYIFDTLGRPEQLARGALNEPINEIYSPDFFQATAFDLSTDFDAKNEVALWLMDWLA